MSSLSNAILIQGPTRRMVGLFHLARRSKISNVCSTRFTTSIAPHISAECDYNCRHRNSPRSNVSTAHILDAKRTRRTINHYSDQRRLRSALPDAYYDYEGETTKATAGDSRATPFLLADIGEGIAEVELLQWYVEEGQAISEFDPVCEVQSDKATVEITSRYEGTVQKLAHQTGGGMIRVGDPILWILEKEGGLLQDQVQDQDQDHDPEEQEERRDYQKNAPEDEPSDVAAAREDDTSFGQKREVSAHENPPKSMAEPNQRSISTTVTGIQEQESVASTFPGTTEKVLTSPAVRKLAMDHNLDLSTIAGTGPAGRILKGDILAVLQVPPPEIPKQSSDFSTTENDVSDPKESETKEKTEECNHPLQENVVVPLRGYNRIMAHTMAASLKIPHMVYSDEINLNRFVRYKMEQQQLEYHNRLDVNSKKLLFLPLAIKAASKALEEYPYLNASFDDTKHEVTLWKDHNIGIAMDTPRGLIVPVIKECHNKSLPEIAEELMRLKTSVTEGGKGLPAKDLHGATFTLSNVGAIGGGGTYMSPIVTPPQVAIGALGQIRRLPRFVSPSATDPAESQAIEEAHICAVSWAADHRVVDGATVARFHKSFKEYMEDPIKLLLELR